MLACLGTSAGRTQRATGDVRLGLVFIAGVEEPYQNGHPGMYTWQLCHSSCKELAWSPPWRCWDLILPSEFPCRDAWGHHTGLCNLTDWSWTGPSHHLYLRQMQVSVPGLANPQSWVLQSSPHGGKRQAQLRRMHGYSPVQTPPWWDPAMCEYQVLWDGHVRASSYMVVVRFLREIGVPLDEQKRCWTSALLSQWVISGLAYFLRVPLWSCGNQFQSITPAWLEKSDCCPGNARGAELEAPLPGYVFWGEVWLQFKM